MRLLPGAALLRGLWSAPQSDFTSGGSATPGVIRPLETARTQRNNSALRRRLFVTCAGRPTTRVVILSAIATPLNEFLAIGACPRPVHSVFLEHAARLAALSVRAGRVRHRVP